MKKIANIISVDMINLESKEVLNSIRNAFSQLIFELNTVGPVSLILIIEQITDKVHTITKIYKLNIDKNTDLCLFILLL